MVTAFQPNAFQNNAFQIDIKEPVQGGGGHAGGTYPISVIKQFLYEIRRDNLSEQIIKWSVHKEFKCLYDIDGLIIKDVDYNQNVDINIIKNIILKQKININIIKYINYISNLACRIERNISYNQSFKHSLVKNINDEQPFNLLVVLDILNNIDISGKIKNDLLRYMLLDEDLFIAELIRRKKNEN